METDVKCCHEDLIHAHMKIIGNGMFSVTFIKKDGSERKMSGRRGVKKHLKTDKPATIKDCPDLYGMYETKNDYRCFSAQRVLELRGAGMITKVS